MQRSYKSKDVDMLVTTSTIIESAIANKTFLQSKRTTWADPFFEDLKTRIDNAVEKYLGVDSAKELRESTLTVTTIQKQAINDLAEVKVQISEDFKKDKARQEELLNQLGFTAHHKEAQKGDQEALIQLLFKFKTNLTSGLKTEISEKGTPSTLLETITGYADTLKKADVSQEGFKGTKKEITAEAVKEFNEIYDQVISISKIANNFYKGQPLTQGLFSYNKVSKTLSASPQSKTTTEKSK
jgi:hypothetical protein